MQWNNWRLIPLLKLLSVSNQRILGGLGSCLPLRSFLKKARTQRSSPCSNKSIFNSLALNLMLLLSLLASKRRFCRRRELIALSNLLGNRQCPGELKQSRKRSARPASETRTKKLAISLSGCLIAGFVSKTLV